MSGHAAESQVHKHNGGDDNSADSQRQQLEGAERERERNKIEANETALSVSP